MTICNAMREYKLPDPSTVEDLECRNGKVLRFGEKVLFAGYFYNDPDKPSYYGAVYEYLTDDTSCEGMIGLKDVSEAGFEDDGHAMAWAMAR